MCSVALDRKVVFQICLSLMPGLGEALEHCHWGWGGAVPKKPGIAFSVCLQNTILDWIILTDSGAHSASQLALCYGLLGCTYAGLGGIARFTLASALTLELVTSWCPRPLLSRKDHPHIESNVHCLATIKHRDTVFRVLSKKDSCPMALWVV